VYGNSRASYQEKQAAFAKQARRFQDERTTLQLCDQVIYPSIRLKEDIVASSTAAKIKSEPTRPAPNTLASVSIAVETARPVTGHLIITELMGTPLYVRAPHPRMDGTPGSRRPQDRATPQRVNIR